MMQNTTIDDKLMSTLDSSPHAISGQYSIMKKKLEINSRQFDTYHNPTSYGKNELIHA